MKNYEILFIYIIRRKNYITTRVECQPKTVHFFFFVGTNKHYVAICIIISFLLSRSTPSHLKCQKLLAFLRSLKFLMHAPVSSFTERKKWAQRRYHPLYPFTETQKLRGPVKATYSIYFFVKSAHQRRFFILTTMKKTVSAIHGRITRYIIHVQTSSAT